MLKLKEFVNDHNLYDDALDSAATWLKTMEKRVRNCNNNSGNWHAIQKRIEDVKVIKGYLICESKNKFSLWKKKNIINKLSFDQ